MYPIPANATRIRYLESTGTQYIDTGVVPTRMMPMGVRKRPYDAEVEYVQATGTQYVDTGVRVGPSLSFASDCAWTQNGTVLYGAFDSIINPTSRIFLTMGGSGTTPTSNYSLNSTKNMVHRFPSSILNSRVVSSVSFSGSVFSGVSVANPSGVQAPPLSALTIYVFARHNNHTDGDYPYGNFVGRLYALEIRESGVLVRDYIPVRVGSGPYATGYLYDRANPTGGPLGNGLYGSATSTPLVAGPDKIPS